MDYALCRVDQKEWHAADFLELDPASFESMKRHLVCTACEGDAWFRKSSFGKQTPHFCAHHAEGCNYATRYQVIDQGDGEGDEPATDPDSGIVINLNLEDGYKIDVADKTNPEDISAAPQLGANIVKGKGFNYPAHHSLKNILFKLVRSNGAFANRSTPVRISNPPFDLPSIASELFINFKSVMPYLSGQVRMYWGFISDADYSHDGKIWLNAGNRGDGLSVAIYPDIVDQFKEYFGAQNTLRDLDGCHVLIIGPCYFAKTGKPIIWCNSLEYIVLRRYRFDTE